MIKDRQLISLLVLFVMVCGSKAVGQVNDAGLWLSVSLEKKLTPGFSLHLDDELRLNENITEAGTHFTEFGGEYTILKGLSAGIYYRFTQKRRVDDSYSKRHRYYAELSYRRKIHKISFTLRERFQTQYADMYSSDKGLVPEFYLRSKLTVKTKLMKATQIFANTEIFYPLSNPDRNEIDGLRVAAGLEYNLKKYGLIEGFYMINKEINVKNPLTDYIIGLGYSYTF